MSAKDTDANGLVKHDAISRDASMLIQKMTSLLLADHCGEHGESHPLQACNLRYSQEVGALQELSWGSQSRRAHCVVPGIDEEGK